MQGVWQKRANPMPYMPPSQMLKIRMTHKRKLEFLHASVFLSFLISRSMGAPIHGILGDEGIVHQCCHAMEIGWPSRKSLSSTLNHFEKLIPGYKPGRRL